MNRLILILCPIALISPLLLVSCSSTGIPKATSAKPATIIRESDITYAHAGDEDVKVDLARPASGGPSPAIIFLYGGEFASGSRKLYESEIAIAAQRGYVGVAVDYRLMSVRDSSGKPKYPFPAQLYDVKCAVRFLRANAYRFAIDDKRIGVLGFMEGAYLALMLGLTEPSDGLEGSCGDSTLSSRVQAVVNVSGPADFLVLSKTSYSGILRNLLGGSPEQVPDRYKAADPIMYVDGHDAPVLTIIGTLDINLPAELSLDERMKQTGGYHTLIVVEGASHNFRELLNLWLDYPVWSFFEEHLKITQ
jgi:acetyl esterase/lipase